MLNRRRECELLDRLLGSARSGESAVLVIRGEPGIGKSMLLDHAASAAAGLRVLRTAGVESEMELAFAAVRQLCAPLLDRAERLAGPQRDALATAFGLMAGNPPNPFMVGLATLSLLSQAGQQQPLLCLIDDTQWLDHASAQTIAFAARRLQADPVAMLFATRAPSQELSGFPELVVRGLDSSDSQALLDSVVGAQMDAPVRDRIITEARGNPLALLELHRVWTPAQLTGGFGVPDASGLPGWLEQGFRQRFSALPAATQRLMLVAAADPTGDPILVWNAARSLGIGPEAAAPAADEDLVMFGSSASAVGRVPGGVCARAAECTPGSRGLYRPAGPPGSKRLASRSGCAGTRRGRSRRTRTRSGPRAGLRRPGSRGRVPGALGRAHARPAPVCRTRACGGTRPAAGRGVRRGTAIAGRS